MIDEREHIDNDITDDLLSSKNITETKMKLSFLHEDKINQLFISPSIVRMPYIFDNANASASDFPRDDDDDYGNKRFDDETEANNNILKQLPMNEESPNGDTADEVLVPE